VKNTGRSLEPAIPLLNYNKLMEDRKQC